MGKVIIEHNMAAIGHIVLVDECTAHHNVNHQRITSGQRLIVGIGPDAVIGRRDLLDIHGTARWKCHRARELVEKELPVGSKRLFGDVLDHETRAVIVCRRVVLAHVPIHRNRGLGREGECGQCTSEKSDKLGFLHFDMLFCFIIWFNRLSQESSSKSSTSSKPSLPS